MHLESKIKAIHHNQQPLYRFLENFEHFAQLSGQNGLQVVSSDYDHCRFELPKVGEVQLQVIERQPEKTIKVEGTSNGINFLFWIQLKQVAEADTRIRLTIKAEMNAMMAGMVKSPMQQFLDTLVEQMAVELNSGRVTLSET